MQGVSEEELTVLGVQTMRWSPSPLGLMYLWQSSIAMIFSFSWPDRVTKKKALFKQRHKGDKYSTKEMRLITFIRAVHTVGFQMRTIVTILAAFAVTLSYFFFFLLSSCISASEIGTKWEPVTAGLLVVSPLFLGYLASSCNSGRLKRVNHMSLLWIYDFSSKVSTTGKQPKSTQTARSLWEYSFLKHFD